MKILVYVREVAIIPDEFAITDNAVEEPYIEYELNEWDDYALEAGVSISEEHDDIEVVTVTIGPERAEETIRTALAKGADRAIRVWDDALAEIQLLDIESRAAILTAVIEEEAPDLVLTGVQAGDNGFGAIGPAVAHRADYAWATVVNHLEFSTDQLRVHRELEGGIEERTDIGLPAVVTVQTGLNDPRYASLREIRMAQRKPIAHMDLASLGVSLDPQAFAIERMYVPETDNDITLWEGDPDETAADLAAYLADHEVVTS